MKSLFRLSLPMLAIAALASACNPFAPKASAPHYPQDPRFSEFVHDSDEKPTVKTRIGSINERWPVMEASHAHVVVEKSRSTGFIPDQDPEFWITAVATVPDETIAALTEHAIGDTALLPGIYPGLYEYVPQECHFTDVDPAAADSILVPDKSKVPHDFDPAFFEDIAMSEECKLLVFTAIGHS